MNTNITYNVSPAWIKGLTALRKIQITQTASGGSGRGSGASRPLPTSVSPQGSSNGCSRALRTPQVNVAFPNANVENVMERSR